MACRNTIALRAYVRLLHGYSANELQVSRKSVEYSYNRRVVRCPPEGAGSFLEVFKNGVYDTAFSPRPGDVCVDVGAYVGMWSVRAALAVGDSGRVIAIEPDAGSTRWLLENVKGLHVTVLPWIASDKDGTESLSLAHSPASRSTMLRRRRSTVLPCRTLDTILRYLRQNRVDFIKLDAEGAEMKVLLGAGETLRGNPGLRLVVASYRDLPGTVPGADEIASYLWSLGYAVHIREGLRRYVHAEKIS
ncbi:MAG: FkbM family methyltransferase [Dehalococcoidia bacterium]|nr:FkbM family methyltransferase [Dehalococcoidia bacterium]